jgi:hypothetical protein
MARKRFTQEQTVAVLWRNYLKLFELMGITEMLRSAQTIEIVTIDTNRHI